MRPEVALRGLEGGAVAVGLARNAATVDAAEERRRALRALLALHAEPLGLVAVRALAGADPAAFSVEVRVQRRDVARRIVRCLHRIAVNEEGREEDPKHREHRIGRVGESLGRGMVHRFAHGRHDATAFRAGITKSL